MATTKTPISLTHDALAALPDSYFKTVDERNIDALLSLFAPNATVTVQTGNITYSGVSEIRNMFTAFVNNSKTLSHEVKNIVVDPVSRQIVTEQTYSGELMDGTQNDMYNCNIFNVDEDGKFTRIIIWMSGANPLK
ncbi:uncharacterized protein TRUGW13939_03034 [Talaromyces rugulosus]|uniref:SnoaL-like domain-containing protein n=1 Tax=Talaromyces rugulosus TaxID=121627 RepID=A0A7H8QR53_TALRU|nr:uncharacterized protein TRUGW13939_03034 [Talaromyces rugulosus]QKX55935.1 hypothetical protein TRUGW13939_03034 [Talaromyces rugulosus]